MNCLIFIYCVKTILQNKTCFERVSQSYTLAKNDMTQLFHMFKNNE